MPRITDGLFGKRPKLTKRTRLRTHDLKLATWNIRTMLVAGKIQEVGSEMIKYGFDVVAIQEHR